MSGLLDGADVPWDLISGTNPTRTPTRTQLPPTVTRQTPDTPPVLTLGDIWRHAFGRDKNEKGAA